jgi:fused signal recognition particle receptor
VAIGILGRLKAGLKKTREVFTTPIGELLRGRTVDADLLEELEERLILADVGPRLALELTEEIRQAATSGTMTSGAEVLAFLRDRLAGALGAAEGEAPGLRRAPAPPTVVLLVGVNGTGKTTTAARLARLLTDGGESVLLAAADTFRAAAGEQLDVWAGRLGVEIVRHADGADPAAVVFDACRAAAERKVDWVLVDTAGRMHNKANLMRELEKIHRVAGRQIPDAPHEVLLVLDATTGQNALQQAKTFSQGVGCTGIVLTKLDGTAKGGIVIAIRREVSLPIKFVGTGERETDLAPFDPRAFVQALFAGMDEEAPAS